MWIRTGDNAVGVPMPCASAGLVLVCLIIVPVGNFQIRTASALTGGLEPPDFVFSRCKALAGVHATVKYLPP